MGMPITECIEEASPVAETVNIMQHIKDRRVEYLLGAVLLHMMGAFNAVASKAQGVCN